MKSISTQTIIILGAIVLLMLLVGGYFSLAEPAGFGPTTTTGDVSGAQVESEGDVTQPDAAEADASAAGGFTLSSAQMDALVSLGIDPEAVPSTITAAQESCFVAALGQERVVEIKAGAVPSGIEFMQAQSCI